jgi:hypothetical protein
VHVISRVPWDDPAEVRRIVQANFPGDPRRPPTIIVLPRRSPADDREGFTPFDRSRPIRLWIEPPARYPEGRWARTWREELALSAAHEYWHWRHPDVTCPGGICERRAEGYARRMYRLRQRRARVTALRR